MHYKSSLDLHSRRSLDLFRVELSPSLHVLGGPKARCAGRGDGEGGRGCINDGGGKGGGGLESIVSVP